MGRHGPGRCDSAWTERWERVIEGPPVPSSPAPQVVSGSIKRRALLLREGLEATETPDGPVTETIGRRMFVDIYDVWPLAGTPTHYRVGNRRAFGWLPAAVVLPWDSRLVIRAAGTTRQLTDAPDGTNGTTVGPAESPWPILAWTPGAVRVAVWVPGRSWEEVERFGWVRLDDLSGNDRGVLLSREELLMLLRRMLDRENVANRRELRLRALLGLLMAPNRWGPSDLESAREFLPGWATAENPAPSEAIIERLSRINERWSAEVSWGGIGFQSVPLEALP